LELVPKTIDVIIMQSPSVRGYNKKFMDQRGGVEVALRELTIPPNRR
jgi:hypothetical protein